MGEGTGESEGKVSGDLGGVDPMATQKGGEDGGVFGFLFWETLFLRREVVAVVDRGLAASAVDFERAEEEVAFSLGCLKPSKRVGYE